jgi:hypothetical protein
VSLNGDQQNSTFDVILGDCVEQWQFDIKLEAEFVRVCAVGTQELRLDAVGCEGVPSAAWLLNIVAQMA